MKCFECGSNCTTRYIRHGDGTIEAVAKACNECEWESYPTKVPKSI